MAAFLYGKRWVVYACVMVLIGAWYGVNTFAATKNGFDLSDALIAEAEILQGGPPRDGIPAIDRPVFATAKDADFLRPQDRVLGVVRNGIAKAYPINILNWHEIVNDRFADEGIVVTFCPLCGTGMVFKSDIAGKQHSFGVSGLLYNSDVLLYDRATESLWSQMMLEAVSGPMKGTKLHMVAAAHTDWADWRARYPETLVLSTETGHWRDYESNPYQGYAASSATIFPYANKNARYHPKELVIGLQLQDQFKAYPFVELAQSAQPIDDKVAGIPIRIEFDAQHRSGRVLDAAGAELPTVIAFWFAWSAFHPQTQVYQARTD